MTEGEGCCGGLSNLYSWNSFSRANASTPLSMTTTPTMLIFLKEIIAIRQIIARCNHSGYFHQRTW
ncbi:MAG: hypothetical protein H7239_07435 [Flavobacterium sp.]|nr:hypothetical protein [Flavobacterium sp.]